MQLKRLFSGVFLCAISINNSYGQSPVNAAQKQRLDTTVLNGNLRWSSVSEGQISNDGRYFMMVLENTEGKKESKTLTVKSVEGSWERSLEGTDREVFSSDSKWLYCSDRNGILLMLRLGEAMADNLGAVETYKLWGEG